VGIPKDLRIFEIWAYLNLQSDRFVIKILGYRGLLFFLTKITTFTIFWPFFADFYRFLAVVFALETYILLVNWGFHLFPQHSVF